MPYVNRTAIAPVAVTLGTMPRTLRNFGPTYRDTFSALDHKGRRQSPHLVQLHLLERFTKRLPRPRVGSTFDELFGLLTFTSAKQPCDPLFGDNR